MKSHPALHRKNHQLKPPLQIERYCLDLPPEPEELSDFFDNFHEHYAIIEAPPSHKDKKTRKSIATESERPNSRASTKRSLKTSQSGTTRKTAPRKKNAKRAIEEVFQRLSTVKVGLEFQKTIKNNKARKSLLSR